MEKLMSQWFEKEDFWITYAPIMFDENHWKEAPTVAEYVKSIAKLSEGDSVLDAGCGLGRISVEMAALGLDVTGVDIIEAELQAAEESANAEGVKLNLVKADLRTFSAPKKYDCVVNLYTSFGYCDSIEEDMKILKNLCDSLKDNGTFIIECVSRETAILYFTEGEVFERAGFTVKTHFEVVGAWEGLRSQWSLYKTDEKGNEQLVNNHVFVQRLYPAKFLAQKLVEFGCKTAEVYGDFDFSPYDQHARTMVIVGRK
ncbi:MAG: class I SAM-dependent methyltransferase [Treponema sp.]|nr:class I SAM-dependent methyltransferase [Treponema sp.]